MRSAHGAVRPVGDLLAFRQGDDLKVVPYGCESPTAASPLRRRVPYDCELPAGHTAFVRRGRPSGRPLKRPVLTAPRFIAPPRVLCDFVVKKGRNCSAGGFVSLPNGLVLLRNHLGRPSIPSNV